MKKFYTILIVIFTVSLYLPAQTTLSEDLKSKYHALSQEELQTDLNQRKSLYTAPPPSTSVRNIAEFEPNQGVIIAYIPASYGNYEGFQVPLDLIKEIAKDLKAYIICKNEEKKNIINNLLVENGVNTENVEYIYGDINSQWVRDFTPWYVEYGESHTSAGINFEYNRPRPEDNNTYTIIGNHLNIDIFSMELVQTGGNYMTDGFGVSASCDVVLEENNDKSEDSIRGIMNKYLGINNYHITPDPLGEYIKHVDCWGKFLDVDKILIGKVPQDNSKHSDFEAMADYWANQTSSYGNKYKVYRVNWQLEGNAYTNSIILNNKVLVPINSGYQFTNYNQEAINAYQEAMPGYEIVGIEYNNWHTTDALHCRTHEIPDLNMLRISHIPYSGIVQDQSTISFSADVYSLNNAHQISSVKLVYKINDNEFSEIDMTSLDGKTYTTSISNINDHDQVYYYIKATDDRPKTEMHPYIGEANPHTFTASTLSSDKKESLYKNSNDDSYIKAFPNPATNELYFVTNKIPENKYRVEITNTGGQVVKELIIDIKYKNWENFILDITDLTPGIYNIRAISDSKIITTRFIKQ